MTSLSFPALPFPWSAPPFTPFAGPAMAVVLALWGLLPTPAYADCINRARRD
jgi:hypothetical protein